jgi:hypothetical protein
MADEAPLMAAEQTAIITVDWSTRTRTRPGPSTARRCSAVGGGGGLGIDLGFVGLGGSVSASSCDAKSAQTFAQPDPSTPTRRAGTWRRARMPRA